MITFLLCACRNIWHVKLGIKENSTAMSQWPISPPISAIISSWPKIFRIWVVKIRRGRRNIEVINKTIHDLWRYTPSMLYCFAPYACPQRVSSALAMPNCTSKFTITIQTQISLPIACCYHNKDDKNHQTENSSCHEAIVGCNLQ